MGDCCGRRNEVDVQSQQQRLFQLGLSSEYLIVQCESPPHYTIKFRELTRIECHSKEKDIHHCSGVIGACTIHRPCSPFDIVVIFLGHSIFITFYYISYKAWFRFTTSLSKEKPSKTEQDKRDRTYNSVQTIHVRQLHHLIRVLPPFQTDLLKASPWSPLRKLQQDGEYVDEKTTTLHCSTEVSSRFLHKLDIRVVFLLHSIAVCRAQDGTFCKSKR